MQAECLYKTKNVNFFNFLGKAAAPSIGRFLDCGWQARFAKAAAFYENINTDSAEKQEGCGDLTRLGNRGCACRVVQHEVVALETEGKGAAGE